MTEQALFILASLTDGPLHGYAIVGEAVELSAGRVQLTAGTLYGALERLNSEGLIEEDREEVVDGRRRRYYRLTSGGAEALTSEAERLRAAADAVERRMALRPEEGAAQPA